MKYARCKICHGQIYQIYNEEWNHIYDRGADHKPA